MAKRLTIVLSDDTADMLLALAGSPRKQSEVLERLIRAASLNPMPTTPAPATDLATIRHQVLRLANDLAGVTARLLELESKTTPAV